MKNYKGLTLIEVILSIAIIGIISISLLPIFNIGLKNIVNAGSRTKNVYEAQTSINNFIQGYDNLGGKDHEITFLDKDDVIIINELTRLNNHYVNIGPVKLEIYLPVE